MASIDRGLDLSGWSDDLRDMLKRRVSESGGVALIVLAALIAVALSTWSVQDPSFSHATDGPVRNFLGTPGAIGADLLMQLFGLASTVLVLPVAVWGWRIATHRPFDREWMRLSFWLAGTVFGAGFVACLPKSEHWPLPSGLGGVIGDAMLRLPALAVGAVAGTTLLVTAAVFGLCTLAGDRSSPPASAITIHPTSSSTIAGRAKPPAPRTTTRSAPRSRSASWCMRC